MQKDVTEVVNEIKFPLIKGVDTREQLTSMGVILLTSEHANVVMARAGGNKVCGNGAETKNLVSTIVFERHHWNLRKEVTVFHSCASS